MLADVSRPQIALRARALHHSAPQRTISVRENGADTDIPPTLAPAMVAPPFSLAIAHHLGAPTRRGDV